MDSIDEAITYDDFEQRYFKTHESLDFDFSTTSIITQNLTAQYQVKRNSDSENEDVKSKNSHVPRKHEANNNSLNCHSEPSNLNIQCQLKSRFNWKSEEVMFGSSSNSSVQEEHENYDNSLISYNEQINFNTQHEMQPSIQTSFANSSIQEKHESKNNSLTSYNGPTNLNTQRHLTSRSNSKGEEVISGCLSNSSVQEEREYNDNSLTSYSEQINSNTQHPIEYSCNLEEKEIISESSTNSSPQEQFSFDRFQFEYSFIIDNFLKFIQKNASLVIKLITENLKLIIENTKLKNSHLMENKHQGDKTNDCTAKRNDAINYMESNTALTMVNSIEKVKTKKRKQTDDTNDGTCTKRTLLTTSKKVSDLKSFGKENNNKDNEISDSELYEKHIYHLQKFLSDKYVDVIDRLKLNYIPNCVRDLLFCKNNHSKNCPGPPIISKMFTYRINQFLIEKRPLNYIKICNSIMQQGIIPDENIFNSIFQLIISYGFEDEILHYTNEYLINESKLTLINFINLFPPCWKGNRNIYLNFCTNPVDQTKYLPENSDPVEKRNMFLFIVYMIEKVAKEEEETLETSVPESEIILNFNEWERKNSKCNNMNAFTREEKLNRLFLSLDIFVKIFETDLSLWILRYLSNPYKHLFTCDKPLIVAALLIKESNFMSDHILKIIELFVSLILNNYPKFQIIVFKRLLSLIYVVINLADAEENAINFPNFKLKSKTMQFSKQIFDSLAGELNFIKFFKIYNHIEIPLVRLLIIDHFIKKLDKDKTAATDYLNPKLIFERFRKLLWQKYEISSTPINYLNEKIINIPYEEKFPNYPKIENKILEIPVLKIYREQYLYLYLEALKAYCDAFFTKNFLLILMDCNTIKPTIVLTKEIEPKKITKKFKLEKLEKDASKLLMGIDLDKAFGNSSSNEIPEYGVDVTYEIIVQYRSDYKYLSLLKKNLPIMIQKFGKEFDIFTEFIEYCFTPE